MTMPLKKGKKIKIKRDVEVFSPNEMDVSC